jgi:hypothetical protein
MSSGGNDEKVGREKGVNATEKGRKRKDMKESKVYLKVKTNTKGA